MMISARVSMVLRSLSRLRDEVVMNFFGQHPPGSLAVTMVNSPTSMSLDPSIKSDLDFDGLLWNTPKKRRSVERRTVRTLYRLGMGPYPTIPEYQCYKPNKKIRVDHRSGEYYELGKLEPKSFKKVMEETKKIQARMKDVFGLRPKDKEVVVTYKGENYDSSDGDSKLIVDIPEERPAFFSPNLMEKVNKDKNSMNESTTVKPSGLG